MMNWNTYIENRVPAKSGWMYLNQEIADQAKTFDGGLYIYTDRYRWEQNRYKIGETIRDETRVFEQTTAFSDEDAFIIGFIPMNLDHVQYDKKIHKILADSFNCTIIQKESARVKTEWIQFSDDVNPVSTTLLAIQKEKQDPSIGRVELNLTLSQMKALDLALDQYENGEVMLAELCPRFGKTVWAISLFDIIGEEVMVVGSYVHSALNSFETDFCRFTQFEGIALAKTMEDVIENREKGLRSIVPVSLQQGSFSKWYDKYSWIEKLPSKFVFVDEADFGAHQPSQVRKVKFLSENA